MKLLILGGRWLWGITWQDWKVPQEEDEPILPFREKVNVATSRDGRWVDKLEKNVLSRNRYMRSWKVHRRTQYRVK